MQVYLYDAFSDRAFGGNVAGVVTDAAGLTSEEMQQVAAELGAPTTGFVVGFERGTPPIFEVRYFTPRRPINLCGHATVAVFTALADEDRCPARPGGASLRLRCASGIVLPIVVESCVDGGVVVEMGQRAPTFEMPVIDADAVRRVLGDVPLHRTLPLEVASTGLRHLVVPFATAADLARLEPDFGALAGLARRLEVDTIAAVTPPSRRGGAIRVRDFCSAIGANEEAASGTTAGAVASWLARHGGLSF
ncbi:MAG: PhzF family phenazine biosynthesis protein, partial [Planctomycetes bacterium]|nr:PhzF family phenazine biosynthesis protein [Planctomycetota bacterium]